MKKYCIIPCPGLGDGLVALTLSYNLYLNNYQATTYHNTLIDLKQWFPHFVIKPFQNIMRAENIEEYLNSYTKIFFFHDDESPILPILKKINQANANKVYMLKPNYAIKKKTSSFIYDSFFKSNITIPENIAFFCKKILRFSKTSISNGIKYPSSSPNNKDRFILHITASKKSREFPLRKYLKIIKFLQLKKFKPIIVMTNAEKKRFDFTSPSLPIKTFNNLNDLSHYIYNSGYMIGNDSGIGHLSASLNLKCIIFFRSYRACFFCKPAWSIIETIYPNKFIPNFHKLRIRDKYWKSFIRTKAIIKKIKKIIV